MRHNPYVVGICNAVIPGLGYILIGERKVFGGLLLAGSVACIILSIVEPGFASGSLFVSQTPGGVVLETLWYLFFLAAFAYDAWEIAKRKKEAALMPLVVENS
jgi:hypothetical protein